MTLAIRKRFRNEVFKPIKRVMKHSLAWIEKFIPSDRKNEIALLSQEKQFETLCKMIESGQIEASAYLNWASQFFLLPSLDSQFFIKVDIKEIWKKYSDLRLWSPEMLPVGEWENRLMVACASPPTEFKMTSIEPPVFVLASPLDLRKTWGQLNVKAGAVEAPVQAKPVAPPAKVAVAPAPKPAAPTETSNLENTATRFELKMDESFKLIDFSAPPEEEKEEVTVEASAPADKQEEESADDGTNSLGLDLDITKSVKAPNFNFGEPKLDSSKKEEKPETKSEELKLDTLPQKPAVVAAPPPPPPPPPHARATPVPLPKPVAAPQAAAPVQQPTPIPTPAAIQKPAPIPLATPIQPPTPPPLPNMTSAPQAPPPLQMKPLGPPVQSKPIAPPPRAMPQAPTPLKVVTTEPVKPISAPTPAPPPAKISPIGRSALKRILDHAKTSFDDCSNYEDLSDVMFSKMTSHFEMAMLIRCEEQGLVPMYWAGNFKIADEQKPSVIPLAQASIFKIVNASGKPYHGYVVANPINTKFFNEWNSGEIPKHVTIFPVFVEKDLVAMWIGATNKSIDLKVSLADMDSFTDSCVASFHKALKSAA